MVHSVPHSRQAHVSVSWVLVAQPTPSVWLQPGHASVWVVVVWVVMGGAS
jgi:hypothetical protein